VGERAVRGASSFLREAMRAPAASVARVEREGGTATLPLPDAPGARLEYLRDLQFAPSESKTAVEVHPEGPPGKDSAPTASPAEAAGIPSGARITAVDGVKVADWDHVVTRIRDAKGGEVEIAWEEAGKERTARVKPVPHASYRLEVGSLPEGVLRAAGPVEAVALGARRCVLTTNNIVATLRGLFSGALEKGAVGGPVMIVQVTAIRAREGFGWFLWILAVLSINLMFLNVLPIPLLDGGQLALLLVEGVTRRRPSDSVVGITQMAGLVILLGVLVLVTFNDIARLVGG
jgi:regulator of sigma E protease